MYQNRRLFFEKLFKAGVFAGMLPSVGGFLLKGCNSPQEKHHILIYGSKKSTDFYQNVARYFSSISFDEVNTLNKNNNYPALISVPLDKRGNIAKAALDEGHSILTEIPPADEHDIFFKIKQLTDENNLQLGLITFHRYLTICNKAQEMLHNGALGNILSVKVQIGDYKADPLFNPENGKLHGYLLHMLDLVQWLTGSAYQGLHIIPTDPDHIEISAKAENFHALFSSIPFKYAVCNTWSVHIIGKNGELRLKDAKILTLSTDQTSNKVLNNLQEPDYKNAIHNNITDFLSARNNKSYHKKNMRDAYRLISLNKAIHNARKTKKFIQLKDIT